VRLEKSFFFVIILLCGLSWMQAQEFRSTTTVTGASQPVTVDLTNISDVHGASISIHNSSSSTIRLPQISTPNNLMPISGPAILAQLNSLPPVSTDQDRAIQAWQYVISRTSHFCGAGGTTPTYDALAVLNSFGFGCCDQLAETLAWIWQQEGYQTRVAFLLNFHDVPEIFFGGAWHMLDPDHNVYYPKDDGTIASVADVLANPNLVARTADPQGNDPVGWPATEMAALYVAAGPTLAYRATIFPSPLSQVTLRPHEGITFFSENKQDSALYYNQGDSVPPSSVNLGQFNWDLSYGDALWKSWAYANSGVSVGSDASGSEVLANSTGAPGYVVYQEFSMFPVRTLSLVAQLGSASGSGWLNAYFSPDGTTWSPAMPLLPASLDSSFDLKVDLTKLAAGAYAYFVKIELNGDMQLHRLRLTSTVQTSQTVFPLLQGGASNGLTYQDASPPTQARYMKIITAKAEGKPLIRGVRAESLVPESATYTLARDYGAANLVDGDPDSLAYPGSTHLDYAIHLNGSYRLSGLSVDWGYYGSDSRYVQSWKVLGRNGGQDWQQLASGGLPGQSTMDVPLNATVTDLRLLASGNNWIGAYEVRVFGTATAPPVPRTAMTVISNVPEDPFYSSAQNYVSANLIDGNSQTLAYPGGTKLDYQVSFTAPTHLSSATITWGYFGTNPIYVQSWAVLGRNSASQTWSTLATGGFPASSATQIDLDFIATDLRITAAAPNWIGIYELTLNGGVLLNGLSSSSNVQEQPTTPGFGAASDLTDGDSSTIAYPGGPSIDYTLDLNGNTYVDAMKITWGGFGTDSSYIQSWRALGLTADGNWEVIGRGGYPNSSDTVFAVHDRYRKLRIAADGGAWLGVYEAQVFGGAHSTAIVRSNVVEDPVYCLAQGHASSNLIDGDTATLAYPGSSHLDYQISFGQLTQLSSGFIDWGAYGTNPLYVNSWSVLGRGGPNQPWTTLLQGGFPGSAITTLQLNFAATDVRIVADAANWIGIYEAQFNGTPAQ